MMGGPRSATRTRCGMTPGRPVVSDAEVAETSYTAFDSDRTGRAVTARLIVRRVKLLPPAGTAQPALVEGLPPPCRVHQFAVDDAAGRNLPPRPRHRRASHRRPQSGASGPP